MEKKAPQVGELFAGKFRIESLLGQGGMGAVYLAFHKDLNKRFAIKVLLGEIAGNPEAVARFKNEASAAAGIQNQHVVQVSDVGESETGLPFMVMEYLEGQDLSQLLQDRGKLPPNEAVDYVLQALEAVHQAHEAKIVHRDLKPSNLFLAKRQDGTSVVKVLDFGISKMQQGEQNGALTSTRSMLGSPLYMSPEQLRSSKTVDARSDIWALGVILYELLTGTVPYVGEALGELFAAILEQDPVPVRERNPAVDPGLEQVVMHCLRKKREERWASVADLAAALAPYATPGKPQGTLVMRVAPGFIPPFPGPPAGTALMQAGPAMAGVAGAVGYGTAGLPPARPQVPSYAGQTGSGSASWATGSGGVPQPEIPKRSTGLLVGGMVAGLLLVVGGVVGFVLLRSDKTQGQGQASATASALVTGNGSVAGASGPVGPSAAPTGPLTASPPTPTGASTVAVTGSSAPAVVSAPTAVANKWPAGGAVVPRPTATAKPTVTAAVVVKPPPTSAGGGGGRHD